MQRISITNPQNIIDGTAKKYYFKLRNTGGPKGDKGDKGDTGQTGPQGPKGDAATVAVGSTTTLAVGQDATVENVGSIYNAVLNFGIPQGPQGPQGAKGDKGDTGAQGETGPRGPQGERGTNATVYVGTTTTTNPGTQARVYNSGTDSNAVLNFEIPRGDVGPMPTIAQTTGQSTTEVMSQKATTDALNTKQNTIDSSHKLSADLVTDTTTTNKFVTASDKTTWNAKQNALTAGDNITISGNTISATDTTYTAGNNIDITDGVISTTAIAPEVVAELPATGTEGKLYLTPKAHTTQTATGNPITATVAEDAGAIESFQLDGDTFQQSYTGKNLLGFTLSAAGGLTASANPDGTINFSGTTSSAWPQLTSPFMLENTIPSGTELTFSITEPLPNNATLWLRVYESASSTTFSQIIIAANTTSKTAIIDRDFAKAMLIIGTSSGAVFDVSNLGLQLEKSSSATSYEPYVGGTPSPNPEYPQPIQTVTGLQTVTVAGKNLFDNTGWRQGQYNNGEWTTNLVTRATTPLIPIEPTTYTISLNSESLDTSFININYFDSSKNWLGNRSTLGLPAFGTVTREQTFTLPQGASYLAITLRPYDTDGGNIQSLAQPSLLMLEKGSSKTDYAPYHATSYPINLGNIELCKLGTYQDYIWKDGDEWKVHKEVGKSNLKTDCTDWQMLNTDVAQEKRYAILVKQTDIPATDPASATKPLFANTLGMVSRISTYNRVQGIATCAANTQSEQNFCLYIQSISDSSTASVDAIKSWLQSNETVVYYQSTTPTNITITDTDLIAQLEAIRTASLQNGTNTITNTATGTNLAGDMEIGYYGYNPRNRYDKWLWLDINNEYEQIGS